MTATREDTRARELARMPKHALARMHAANGGLMGVATYRTWTRDELVRAVLEDEASARAYDNCALVRALLRERQPAFAAALELAAETVSVS